MRRTVVTRIVEAAKAIGLCHNVTPIVDTNQFVWFIPFPPLICHVGAYRHSILIAD